MFIELNAVRMVSLVSIVLALSVTACFCAEITGEGHRFIAGQDGKHLAIVNAKGEIEWSCKIGFNHDAHLLPNGNIVIGNCHAGDKNPQIIEVTRDKKVAW